MAFVWEGKQKAGYLVVLFRSLFGLRLGIYGIWANDAGSPCSRSCRRSGHRLPRPNCNAPRRRWFRSGSSVRPLLRSHGSKCPEADRTRSDPSCTSQACPE